MPTMANPPPAAFENHGDGQCLRSPASRKMVIPKVTNAGTAMKVQTDFETAIVASFVISDRNNPLTPQTLPPASALPKSGEQRSRVSFASPQRPDQPHLDAAHSRRRDLRGYLDDLVQVPDEVEPGQLFLRLRKGAVGSRHLAVFGPA